MEKITVHATKLPSRPLMALLSLLGLGTLLPGWASAALGELESSVKVDAAQVQGSIKIQERTLYRVHEIQTPSGTIVREFVSPAGTVFAVAWRGPMMPNLRQTLGQYFDNYVAASKLKEAHHRRVQIHQDDLVVESAGHMRAFAGRAYLPGAIPSGVNLGDLQ
jgi:hypothetical protein